MQQTEDPDKNIADSPEDSIKKERIMLSHERTMLSKERTMLAIERNQLSAERTFSAWIRTGLAGVGGGLAISRLITFHNFTHQLIAKSLGQLLILWGILIFIFAILGYYRICSKLSKTNGHKVSKWQVTAIAFMVIFFSFLILMIATF